VMQMSNHNNSILGVKAPDVEDRTGVQQEDQGQKHIQYQHGNLPRLRESVDLDENSMILEVINALVERGRPAEATELLFASDRGGEITKDRIGFGLYLNLWTEILAPSFIPEIAAYHHWGEKPERKGLAIEVYSGEYLIIEEPVATKVLDAWK